MCQSSPRRRVSIRGGFSLAIGYGTVGKHPEPPRLHAWSAGALVNLPLAVKVKEVGGLQESPTRRRWKKVTEMALVPSADHLHPGPGRSTPCQPITAGLSLLHPPSHPPRPGRGATTRPEMNSAKRWRCTRVIEPTHIPSAFRSPLTEDSWVRERELLRYIPFDHEQLWSEIESGRFPTPYELAPNFTAWRWGEVLSAARPEPREFRSE